MSKKHFNAIAAAINTIRDSVEYANYDQDWKRGWRDCLKVMAVEMANICAKENSNFDRQRFMAACGF